MLPLDVATGLMCGVPQTDTAVLVLRLVMLLVLLWVLLLVGVHYNVFK
jgi:hypothetical protein